MENQRDFKAPKFKSFDGGAVSPLNVLNLSGRRYNTMFDPYASDSSNSPSPLMKYLRCADPSPTAASRTPFISPVKVEEDVIVMDGIPVPKSNKGGGEVRIRSPLTPSDSVNCIFNGVRSPSSGSGGRASGGIENSKYHKNKLCRFWETGGICQFGYDCQFAHGKEELRAPRYSGRIKLEISNSNSSSSVGSNSSSYGKKCSPISKVKAAAEEEEVIISLPPEPIRMALLTSPVQLKQPPSGNPNSNTNANPPTPDWSPDDDGIDITIPCGSTEEDFDAYVEKVLYGTNSKKRLAVFEEICSE